eukprot:2779815-Rhodomonas_salina.1
MISGLVAAEKDPHSYHPISSVLLPPPTPLTNSLCFNRLCRGIPNVWNPMGIDGIDAFSDGTCGRRRNLTEDEREMVLPGGEEWDKYTANARYSILDRSGRLDDDVRVHPEIKYKKPQFQYDSYQKCGFLYLISLCMD